MACWGAQLKKLSGTLLWLGRRTNEPVVAVGVAPAAVAGEVVAGVDLEVGRLKALVIATQRTHAARPRLLYHQVPAITVTVGFRFPSH